MSPCTARARRPVPPLTTPTAAGLLGSIGAFSLELLLIGTLDREITIVVLCLLGTLALMMTGWRWAPLAGALLLGAIQANNPFLVYNLSHPERFGFFAATAVNVGCSLVVLTGGIGATIQTYRGVNQSPRWLGSALIGLAGIVLGALLVAGSIAVQPTAAAPAAGNQPLTVALKPGAFAIASLTVATGQSVRLTNGSPVPHVIANGRWDGPIARSEREALAPRADQLRLNRMGETAAIGPFTAAGTYRYFCPLHPGMNLTVTA